MGSVSLKIHEAQQLLVAIALLDDPVADVGAVEAGDEGLGILQGQPVDDLAAGEIVGSERQARPRRVTSTSGSSGMTYYGLNAPESALAPASARCV